MLIGVFSPLYSQNILLGHRAALRGRLLAAELRGQRWPHDNFDATGAPLRAFKRDGILVGAYSVGPDGIDNGGDAAKDRYFPLYGPREAPKSSP